MGDRAAGKKPKPKKRNKKGMEETLTKEEKAIASHVYFNCTYKTTIFAGNEVRYFKAADALACLAKSKWGPGGKVGKFAKEAEMVEFMNDLMAKGKLFRARQLVRKKKEKAEEAEDEGAETSKNKEEESTPKKAKKSKKSKEKEDETATEDPEKEEKAAEDKEDKASKDSSKKKKKKKVKLDIHMEQIFFDSGVGSDVYVWTFEPSSWTQYLIGALIVIGAIVACLFPLWPPWLRLGVYYLSLVAMVGVGVLIGLIVLRTIVFAVVWLASVGKHHLWILPNLTEDCGFFESFKPAYDYKYYPSAADKEKADRAAREEAEEEDEDEDEDEALGGEGPGTGEEEEEGSQATGSSAEASSAPPSPEQSTGSGPRQRKNRRARRENEGFEIVDQPED